MMASRLDRERGVLLDGAPRHDAHATAGGEDAPDVLENRDRVAESVQGVLTRHDVEGLVFEGER